MTNPWEQHTSFTISKLLNTKQKFARNFLPFKIAIHKTCTFDKTNVLATVSYKGVLHFALHLFETCADISTLY
uniref:Uncharacterized protein n=1 Tax=Arundo donax TaxID=35708 RepID=A0A0A8XNL4_ARUDO